MDLPSIPNNCQMPVYFTFNLLQEKDNIFCMKILIGRQQHEMKTYAQCLGAKGSRTDYRYLVVPSRAIHNRCLPARRQGSSHYWSEQKVRFIQQSDFRAPFTRLPDDPRPLDSDPALHLRVIAFPRMLLWFLASLFQRVLNNGTT
jgi:hypothetical protein